MNKNIKRLFFVLAIMFTVGNLFACAQEKVATQTNVIAAFETYEEVKNIGLDEYFFGKFEIVNDEKTTTQGDGSLKIDIDSETFNTKSQYAPKLFFNSNLFANMGNYEKITSIQVDVFNDSDYTLNFIIFTRVGDDISAANIIPVYPKSLNIVSLPISKVLSMGAGALYDLFISFSCIEAYEDNQKTTIYLDNLRYNTSEEVVELIKPLENEIINFSDLSKLDVIKQFSKASPDDKTKKTTDYYNNYMFPVCGLNFSSQENIQGKNSLRMFFNSETISSKSLAAIHDSTQAGFMFAESYLKLIDFSSLKAEGELKRNIVMNITTDSFSSRKVDIAITDKNNVEVKVEKYINYLNWDQLVLSIPADSTIDINNIVDLKVSIDKKQGTSCNFFIEKIYFAEL